MTKPTNDHSNAAIKTLSRTRDLLDNQLLIVADHVLQMRERIDKQAACIAEGDTLIDKLQAHIKELKDLYAGETENRLLIALSHDQCIAHIKELEDKLDATRAVLEARTRQTDSLKDDIGELEDTIVVYKDNAVPMNTPYMFEPKYVMPDDWEVKRPPRTKATDNLALMRDLAAEGPNLTRKMKRNQQDRMANVCRLASAAIVHLETITLDDCHIEAAIALLKPLATGVHDTHTED